MKAMWSIFRQDLRKVRTSVFASLIVCGVVLIPLTFTWLNVLASWEPLHNTSGLTVAVASEDEGYTSSFSPTGVNVGEKVLSALRANEQLDWVITSTDAAVEGAKSGEYYAAIVIPKSFSRDIVTFYSTGAQPTRIELYSNEKKNPLSPKITDAGAHGVSNQVAEEFARTLGDVSLGFVSSLSEFLSTEDAAGVFQRMQSRAAWVESQLRTSAGTARAFAGLLESSVPLVDSAQRLMNAPLPEVPAVDIRVDVPADDLRAAVQSTIESYDAVGARVDELFAHASATHADQVKVLQDLSGGVGENVARYEDLRELIAAKVVPVLPEAGQSLLASIDEAIAAQKSVEQRLRAAAQSPAPSKPDLSVIDRAKKALTDAGNSQLPQTLSTLKQSIEQIKGNLSLPDSQINIDTAALTRGASEVSQFAEKLESNAAAFGKVRQALEAATGSGDLAAVAAVIGSNPDALAASIAAPVEIQREPVFPIAAFGVGMAPLYTTLALWLGALLAGVSLRLSLPGALREGWSAYWGHFGLFALIGLAQSTVVGLGLILFVKIQPVHPFLLMLCLWVSSVVFMLTVYSFVAAFANAGKALGVLMLVFQISAAGGAYPLELLPQWFQNLNPWLPATYTIRAFQAATAGTYDGDYLRALGMLLLFAIPAIFLGTVVRSALANYNRKLTATLESTHLI